MNKNYPYVRCSDLAYGHVIMTNVNRFQRRSIYPLGLRELFGLPKVYQRFSCAQLVKEERRENTALFRRQTKLFISL